MVLRRLVPIVAVSGALAVLAAACGSDGGDDGPPPTYYRDVEPLVQTRCAGCHRAGGIAPFAFEDHEDVASRAALVADVVEAREMPPWPPGERSVPLRHSRALAEEEVRTIVRWARGGAEAGDPADHRERSPELPAIRADVSLAMAEAYAPDATAHDDYRCFPMDVDTSETRWVTGYDVVPGTPGVHHVILFVILEGGVEAMEALDAADAGPGWTCFGGTGLEDPAAGFAQPVRMLGGWAPGSGASPLPEGTAIELPAGSRVVMQVHYNTMRTTAPDRTQAFLQLGAGAGLVPAVLVPLLDDDFVVPPGATGHVVEETATIGFPLPPATLWGAFPHMHLHGTSITVSVARGGAEKILVDIPRWDFHWQGGYQFVTPEPLRAGDSVRLSCVFDNSDGTAPLTWGEGTEDEMCVAFLYATLGAD